MKLPLKREPRRGRWRDDPHCVDWLSSVPFFVNPRGVLVHRIRYGCTHVIDGEFSHHSVSYFCGNIGTSDDARDFVEIPPEDRVLCTYCEARAVAAGLPSADQCAGRHVHVGRARVERVCCRELKETN